MQLQTAASRLDYSAGSMPVDGGMRCATHTDTDATDETARQTSTKLHPWGVHESVARQMHHTPCCSDLNKQNDAHICRLHAMATTLQQPTS